MSEAFFCLRDNGGITKTELPAQPSHTHHRSVLLICVGKNNICAELDFWSSNEEREPSFVGSRGAAALVTGQPHSPLDSPCWDPGAGDCKGEHNAGLGHKRRVVTLQAR